MTKSFLINTSVAAIVSAFVFTAGVSSASARGDNDQYGHASQSDGYKGSYGGHYRKHYSHKPHHSYGRYGGSRGYGHHPKHYSHTPYTSYGSYGGASSYGNYGRHYRKHYARNPYNSYGSYAAMASTSPYRGWEASPYYTGAGYYAGSGPYAAYAYSPKEYRRYNGMVCAPGTLTKMDDGKMYRCQ